MRTQFTDRQRSDPRIRAADEILRKCVHCGFCAPSCPTYRLTGDELDGPRGRIWLIRDLLEAGADEAVPAADPGVVDHLDRCLGCLACMPACPSGVDYHGLIGIARDVVEERARRGPAMRLYRAFLGRVLPSPRSFVVMLWLSRLAAPARRLLGRRIGAGLRLAKAVKPVSLTPKPAAGRYPPTAPRRGRVALIAGCAQSVLAPGVNAALIRILNRAGCEAVVLGGAACCGALNEHLGQGNAARAHARAVIVRVLAEADAGGLDAVVQTASGCGTLMKSYGGLLAGDPDWEDRARRVAALVRDASEFLATLELSFPGSGPGHSVAWQAPCSLANGQGAAEFAPSLLRRAGFEVHEPPEGPICCGSAGTYNLTEPEIAARLGEDKARALARLEPDAIASANLGCMVQLAGRLATPVVHVVELIDWAQGGPAPIGFGDTARDA